MATAALIVSAVSGVAAGAQTAKGNRQNRKASRVKRRIAESQEAKSRRQTVARSRTLQAQTQAQAVNAGVGGGSASQGAIGSLSTQTSDALSFNQQLSQGAQTAFSYEQSANKAFGNAGTFQAISKFSGTFT